MTLDIIGAGLGRTGTLSLRTALIKLGYPCGHMMDVMFDQGRKTDVDFWLEVSKDANSANHDWDSILTNRRALVDYPACGAWRGLLAAFPKAKVIFTLHPKGPEAWYDSTRGTIYAGTELDAGTPFGKKINMMMDNLIWNGLMQRTMETRDLALARYHSHLADVRATVPPDQLLVYTVTEGWDPLCAFLGLPVPAEPFPQVNGREEMARVTTRLKRMQSFGLGKPQA